MGDDGTTSYLNLLWCIWLMTQQSVPEELQRTGQEVVDSFFGGPVPEPKPKKPKELPVKCPKCGCYTFASFGACHFCENPIDAKGRFKYKKATRGY